LPKRGKISTEVARQAELSQWQRD